MISIDSSVLLSYYNSKEGILNGSSSASTSGPTTSGSSSTAAPTPPWDGTSSPPSALAALALSGHNVINPNAAQTDVPGASVQYKSLFTLYQGLNALSGLTAQMLSTSSTALSNKQAATAFNTGLSQVTGYVNGLSLPNVRLTNGQVSSSATTAMAPAVENDSFTTGVIFTGGLNDAVPAFQGNVQFSIDVTKFGKTQTSVPIDLSQMDPSLTRSMPNVVNFINSQLKAAGVATRFATNMTAPKAQTIQVGGKTVTLPAGPDQWAFKINGDSAEAVSFSAPSTAAAVYVAQTSGNPAGTATTATSTVNKTGAAADLVPIQQLIKLQASDSSTATPPPAALALPGTANSVAGEAQATTLGTQVGAIHATATGPDGSVYVVADVTGSIAGQTIQGGQDVALLKYDSVGQLQSATTLGASGITSGYSIAVSATGNVAVAGSVNGAPDVATPTSSTNTASSTKTVQSFVSVFNSEGDLQWTQQNNAVGANQANGVAFGTNGSVYVVGQTSGGLPGGGSSNGGQDGYLQGYSATGTKLFTTQFGTSGTDAAKSIAVDGSNVVVAGVENGDGVLRSFTLNAVGAPTAGATRDLGNLGSGSIAGVAINGGQVVVAGTTTNGALSAGAVTSSYSGGQDAFVAQLSENLTPSSGDAVAYYGGTGNDNVTALSVANGQVYIAGVSNGGLPGLANPTFQGAAGTKEGYVANINVATGAVQWSQVLQGQDGYDAPESIAVDASGASVLDRLGLPNGTLQYTSSQLLTSATSVRAGDQFQIQTKAGGSLGTVTISATDTPQTLAHKITQAAGYQVTVTVAALNGKEEVQIKPQNPTQTLQLLPGPSGKDALAPLGLNPGLIQTGPAIVTPPKAVAGAPATSVSKKLPTDSYGLNLDQTFDLTTTAGIKAAQQAIQSAMAKVQNAYYNLNTATNPPAPAVTGTVPAYLTSEIANYKGALARLTGSTSSSSTSSSTSSGYSSSSLALQILA